MAHTWGRANLKPGDRILLTEMEHHANIVPWLMLAEEIGLEIRYIPVDGRAAWTSTTSPPRWPG